MNKTSRIRSTRDPNRMTAHSHGYGAAPSHVGEQAFEIATQAMSVHTNRLVRSIAEPVIDRNAHGRRGVRWRVIGLRGISIGVGGVFINERRVA